MKCNYFLLFGVWLLALGCEPAAEERELTVDLYLTGPLTSAEAGLLPPEFVTLLEPRTCAAANRQLAVRLRATRLDLDPVEATDVAVPLGFINSLRQTTDTYTQENRVQNFIDNQADTELPELLSREGDQPADLRLLTATELYYCCGEAPPLAGVRTTELPLASLPDLLGEVACRDSLPVGYAVAYLYRPANAAAGSGVPAAVPPPTAPAPAPAAAASLRASVDAALNYLGNQDIPPADRLVAIPQYEHLFTQNALVKIYGDGGTVVANAPVSEYLERLAGYQSVTRIHVDQALEKDGRCWEVRLRETHN